ncbi:unnamed protein product [Boreogadus saida]
MKAARRSTDKGVLEDARLKDGMNLGSVSMTSASESRRGVNSLGEGERGSSHGQAENKIQNKDENKVGLMTMRKKEAESLWVMNDKGGWQLNWCLNYHSNAARTDKMAVDQGPRQAH